MKTVLLSALFCGVFCLCGFDGCTSEATSTSGVTKATTDVQTDLNGRTIEQNNIINRLKADNLPGSIKHLYLISAYSGEVILYSTVRGKVTSSGKRLSPTQINGAGNNYGFSIPFGNSTYYTNEVLSDDGAYGSSVEYIYWWDSKGVYHQQYITGGMILHISSEPIAVKSVTLNLELSAGK